MQIIIVRHGQSTANLQGVLQGHLDTDLTDLGFAQAKAVANRLAKLKIDQIYTSDLKRAANTAKVIGSMHDAIPFITTAELRERSFGEKEGLSRKKLGIQPGFIFSLLGASKKGESVEEFFGRAKVFVNQILKKDSDQTVVLVCHKGMEYALISAIKGLTFNQVLALPNFKNTNVSHYKITEKGVETICESCVSHL